MNGLISRSALISRFKQLQGSDTLANMFVSDVIKEVKNHPTAYNVENVLQQIKELREYCSNTNCGVCKYKDSCFDAELEKIVKVGGVNG